MADYQHGQFQPVSPAPNVTPVPSTTPVIIKSKDGEGVVTDPIAMEENRKRNNPFLIDNPSTLQRHVMFFDRNKDGVLTPLETFEGFRVLGYGYFLSLLGTFVIHLVFSYMTLDTWIPDPFFTIYIKNIHRAIHGSDTGIYDHDGNVKEWRMGEILQKFASTVEATSGTGRVGLSFGDGWRLTETDRDIYDPIGWVAAKLEWFFLYVLIAKDGIVSKEDIKATYDGSLFERIERERRNQHYHHQ
jgi:peroxygenase